jgi:hypothetical protein
LIQIVLGCTPLVWLQVYVNEEYFTLKSKTLEEKDIYFVEQECGTN